MSSGRDEEIDDFFAQALVADGFLRCGPSRAYVEFEAVVVKHEATLQDAGFQREFAAVAAELAFGDASKLDYQGWDDPRGHKISLQVSDQFATALVWSKASVPGPMFDFGVAAVRVITHDLRRSPIRFLPVQPERRRSTVRGIVYYPGTHPGVELHTDGCLAQFIAVPAGDDALTVARTTSDGARDEIVMYGGRTPETLLLLGRQAGELFPGASATWHRVGSVSQRRSVVTHFLWLREAPAVEAAAG